MGKNKEIRIPKQSRSINMKEKILETGFDLFCKKGFYKTTTNEIAKTAGVSIGSLYSYFKDRNTILLEILEKYHNQFIALHNESISRNDIHSPDKKEWLYNLIEGLIKIHNKSKEFNRELKVLYYSNPDVAVIINKQNKETLKTIKGYLNVWNNEIKSDDIEAIAIISFDFITALVDRIVFGENTINKKRILKTGIDALYNFIIS